MSKHHVGQVVSSLVEVIEHDTIRNGAGVIGRAVRLLVTLGSSWRGVELSVVCTGAGATRNGARRLVFQVACSVTKVLPVCRLRTFDSALVPLARSSESSFLKCFEVRSL
ncbi:hypothetical protein AMTR_s00010p00240450 [Amborella trichopoda]|uniref:Uncharacterized protein n=1 Tax=Amborella trichopoda TaxID=13333 RepID=W1NFT5_AMBTC|nr:hypothetical protein AMTR_s00010p00240450 [Amborella trichopoda]